MRHRHSTGLAALALAASLAGCGGEAPRPEGAPPRPAASGAPTPPASAAPESAGAAPAAPDSPPPMVAGPPTPDSLLPRRSYDALPGWLVMGGRGWPRHVGVLDDPAANPLGHVGAPVDSAISIYPGARQPGDSAWWRVTAGTPFVLLVPDGVLAVRAGGAAESDDDLVIFRVVGERPFPITKLPIAWMLPASLAPGAAGLAVRESVAPDSSARVWTFDSVRVRLQLTGKETAEFWAERDGVAPLRVRQIGIDRVEDRNMGADADDTTLTLGSWRMPKVVAAARLGASGPVVAVWYQSGYECGNWYLIVFDATKTEVLDRTHYYQCAH